MDEFNEFVYMKKLNFKFLLDTTYSYIRLILSENKILYLNNSQTWFVRKWILEMEIILFLLFGLFFRSILNYSSHLHFKVRNKN